MLDSETQVKYRKILNNGKTLKLSALDAIDLVKKYDDLVWEDQHGISTRSEAFANYLSQCKDKVILKFFTMYKNNNKKILYWCPCNINDIVTLAGASQYSEKSGYINITPKKREEQLTFLGDDIRRSCGLANLNSTLKEFKAKYIDIEHPLALSIFYIVYPKDSKTINCARNTSLSPRPYNKNFKAK